MAYQAPILRNIYRVLATQYDPLGYRAKLIIQQLWDKQHGWDDPLLPSKLLQAWSSCEAKLESPFAVISAGLFQPLAAARVQNCRV